MTSGVKFGTSGFRDDRSVFTKELVARIGVGIQRFLQQNYNQDCSIIIGYDTREKSKVIAEWISRTLSQHVDIRMVNRPSPTPCTAFYCAESPDVQFGIIATASHNPSNYNGIKLVTSNGSDATEGITNSIESEIPSSYSNSYMGRDTSSEVDVVEFYNKLVVNSFKSSKVNLDGVNIVHDCVHGTGSGVLSGIMKEFGANVREVRNTLDQNLHGVEPNPSVVGTEAIEEHMRWADLGFVSDGDADRIRVVTSNGVVDGSELLALIYEYLITEGYKGDAVRTVGGGSMIDSVAQSHGQSVYESEIGFKNIARKIKETDSVFGGDQTDGYCYSNHLLYKDGIYTALVISTAHVTERIDKRIRRLRDNFGRKFTGRENVACSESRKQEVMREISNESWSFNGKSPSKIVEIDGLKIYFDDVWVLVRPSGTEPKIRIYAESESKEETSRLLQSAEQKITDVLE